jgi:hypothetical protein
LKNQYFYGCWIIIQSSTLQKDALATINISPQDSIIIKMICHQSEPDDIALALNTTIEFVEGELERIRTMLGARTNIGILYFALKTRMVKLEEL